MVTLREDATVAAPGEITVSVVSIMNDSDYYEPVDELGVGFTSCQTIWLKPDAVHLLIQQDDGCRQ